MGFISRLKWDSQMGTLVLLLRNQVGSRGGAGRPIPLGYGWDQDVAHSGESKGRSCSPSSPPGEPWGLLVIEEGFSRKNWVYK